jgi:tryptophan-rich sensory protein
MIMIRDNHMPRRPAVADFIGLFGWLAVTFAVATFGSQFRPGDWYQALAKPALTPPGWIFPVVWTLLYALMAFSAWMIWRRGGFKVNRLALSLYGLQLIFNGLWSWLFFGQHQIGPALVDIVILLTLIILTAVRFWNIHRPAGILLAPYILWVSFATCLNYMLWVLN